MRFNEQREFEKSVIDKMIDKYDRLFAKENISTSRRRAIAETVQEVISQLRTKDMLK